MKIFPVRLTPDQDLRPALEAAWEFARGADAVTGFDELMVRSIFVNRYVS